VLLTVFNDVDDGYQDAGDGLLSMLVQDADDGLPRLLVMVFSGCS
jgi:hypothetical protein